MELSSGLSKGHFPQSRHGCQTGGRGGEGGGGVGGLNTKPGSLRTSQQQGQADVKWRHLIGRQLMTLKQILNPTFERAVSKCNLGAKGKGILKKHLYGIMAHF